MLTTLITLYRDRVQHRPDSEHAQAAMRLGIIGVALVYSAWIASHDPDAAVGLWVTNLSSAAFALLLFARILRNPRISPWRRVIGIVHDNVALTIWLYMAGPVGALYLFVYPFVTVGNGFRFGVRYLAVAGLLGAMGIGSLIAVAPAWQADRMVGVGVLVSHAFVTGYVGLLLARLHRLQQQLERMATHDPLTGLPNRRLFLDALSKMLADRRRASLACLYLDLDGFKVVNDRSGHTVGDRLLARVADTISGCVRLSDLTARLGGDEFAIILVGLTSPDNARMMAQRIIRTIAAIAELDGHPVEVSASVGIVFLPATVPPGTVSTDALVKSADEAMYRAKKSAHGQIRLVNWSDAPPGVPADREGPTDVDTDPQQCIAIG